ncbi:MAG: 23S rRNA (uracil(1939)-C(5))-methyltransferase RlmD [Clostridiales bacterium]|jgi:23S rRNA (uracil1939-C5)-methyltransferase|nr:23S rRNA (uracil(1939)-C(5))-methyltransferase RlmD [Clostridiales bacterium]
MYDKNDEIFLDIQGLSSDGAGIARVDGGFTFFVKNALPGEAVRAKIIKLHKSYGIAKILEIMKKSGERTRPPCPAYKFCGGCSLQHMDYAAQLRFKGGAVFDALRVIGGLPEEELERFQGLCAVGMDYPFRYRNKAQFPAGAGKDGSPVFGYFAERSHNLIPLDDCLIARGENAEIIRAARAFAQENKIPVYDEKKRAGVIRHLITRVAQNGDIMACLAINADALPFAEKFAEKMSAIPRMSSVLVNVNKTRGNLILGEKFQVLRGEPRVTDEMNGFRFRISAASFYQVNCAQTKKLYAKVLEYAGEGERAADLYCGIGSITLPLSRNFGRVTGVESVPEAVANARENAALNGVSNADFILSRTEEFTDLERIAAGCSAVVLDPPRKGCARPVISALVAAGPPRVVYVSCNPATLARDLALFAPCYSVKALTVFDCFPQTAHAECVALLMKV